MFEIPGAGADPGVPPQHEQMPAPLILWRPVKAVGRKMAAFNGAIFEVNLASQPLHLADTLRVAVSIERHVPETLPH